MGIGVTDDPRPKVEHYLHQGTHEVPDTVNAVLEYPEGFTVNLSSTFNNEASAESG